MYDNDGLGGNNGFWIILLFLFLFGGNGWGNNSMGAQENYVLASDFATIQRQLSDGFNSTENKLDSVNNGICSLGYDQLRQMNDINTNIMTTGNRLQSSIDNGFCQTNFNLQTATRDITDNANANTKAILDFLVNDKITTLQNENNALRLQASQVSQNAYIINALKPAPVPAYSVPNPYATYGFGCNCGV